MIDSYLETPENVQADATNFSMQKQREESPFGSVTKSPEKETVFPISKPITKERFEELKVRKNEPMGLSFSLTRVHPGEKAYIVNFTATGDAAGISAEFPFNVSEKINTDSQDQFRISEEGRLVTYQTDGFMLDPNTSPTGDKDELIDGYNRRLFPPHERSAIAATTEEVAQLLKDTPGEEIVFYTGAGISRGGEAPVWDLGALTTQLHMHGIWNGNDPQAAITTFLPVLANNPDSLINTFTTFNEQLYTDISSPAHQAIAEIVKAKPGAIILTENLDLKHEAEGSRVEAVHTLGPESFDTVRARAEKAQLLVTVGLGADHRAIIAYLKDKNPQLAIVALSLPPRSPQDLQEIPSYVQEDRVLYGDCQVLLPQVAQMLAKETDVNTLEVTTNHQASFSI